MKFISPSTGVYHVALRETDDSGGTTIVSHPVKVTKATLPKVGIQIDLAYSQDALGTPILRTGKGYPLFANAEASPSAASPG